MKQINIHEAKTTLSKLVDEAANGASFVIAKSGKPMVTVTAYAPPEKPVKRIGFLKGMIKAPDDFDTMGGEEIAAMFEGGK